MSWFLRMLSKIVAPPRSGTIILRSILTLTSLLTLLFTTQVRAHAFTPAAVWIEETDSARYDVSFRRSQRFAEQLVLDLPKLCAKGPARSELAGDQRIDHFQLSCERPLQGQTLRVLGLSELSLVAVVQATFRDGRRVREVLSAQRLSLTVPNESWLADVFGSYLALGVEHLLTGWDHLLFVLGLLFLVQGLRRVFWTLTAFTLGHSLTLALSALSIVRPPQAPVELGIALSLLAVALQMTRMPKRSEREDRGLLKSPTFVLAGSFGLLHGLGFAGALAEVGLPEGEIPLALLAFNLGIEASQILSVSMLLSSFWMARRLGGVHHGRLRMGAAYVIGSLSIMWCIERVAELVS